MSKTLATDGVLLANVESRVKIEFDTKEDK